MAIQSSGKSIHQVLKAFWGYDAFRPLQEEIINSILSGKDTLALLPTGGGKSICFQVPAMACEGICIVISPLVALMKDQVENLEKVGIKAAYVYSGMKHREIDIVLDNCVNGYYSFLYISPERLKTELFIERFRRMNVSFIAVDEAHCISQWGYDFRPAYLDIASIKAINPAIPILALTASATPQVQKDIMEKLRFNNFQVFTKSFDRANLIYAVTNTEDKFHRMLYALERQAGTAIIYVRNRRLTVEIANKLNQHNISADYYHAGLSHEQRNQRQEDWKQNRVRVIVCTNAFGMGIDKPDVRLVLHFGLPDSLEAYYQEAGRAGRDEKTAYAIALYDASDQLDPELYAEQSIPPNQLVRKVYEALANHFSIAIGSGQGQVFPFELTDFCKKQSLHPMQTFAALRILDDNDYITLSDAIFQPSRLKFLVNTTNVRRFSEEKKPMAEFVNALLRSHGNLFDEYGIISELMLSRLLKVKEEQVVEMLSKLMEYEIVDYVQATDKPLLTWTHERIETKEVRFDEQYLHTRRENLKEKCRRLNFYLNTDKCRCNALLDYFGEKPTGDCGHCDNCLKKKSLKTSFDYFQHILGQIPASGIVMSQLKMKLNTENAELMETLRIMMDRGDLVLTGDILRRNQ